MPGSESTIPSLVGSAWRTAPPVLRRFAYWVWGIGLVVVTASVVADIEDWWGGLQFTTNILAELIFSLISLPVALVIIARIAEYQVKELDRARLDKQYAVTLKQMAIAVKMAYDYVQEIEQEASASTNNFAAAIKVVAGELSDPESALESARILRKQMDSQQWLLHERNVVPLRIAGNHLQSVLGERDRNSDLPDVTVGFERLWTELESAFRHLRQTMTAGHQMFDPLPVTRAANVTRLNRLRDAAFEHLNSIDRLSELCQKLEAFTAGPDSFPDLGVTQ